MIGAPMHPHAAARGYSRPAPDPIVAPAQSSREGSAGIRVRARNARLTQGTGPVETAAAVQMGMVAFGRLSLDHFHRCLQKPPQKTLPPFAQLHTGRRRFITIILERTKTGASSTGRCNTCIKCFCRSCELQRLAWPLIELPSNRVQMFL